jgi:uncharacterized protein (TIGR02145 family)
MLINRIFTAVCIVASICAAQAINIRGTVKDSAGAGIAGATVKLEAASISTTTGSDGSFTLAGNPAGVIGRLNLVSTAGRSIRFQKGKLEVSLSVNTRVTIHVHDASGRQIFSDAKLFNAGTHFIPSHSSASGLNLYRITIGQNVYTLKASPLGMFSGEPQPVYAGIGGAPLSKQSKATAAMRDVIFITKEGQIDYRDSIKTSDTSGIVVKMIPNAGNVTDADGNVYQSVRIGTQVWTVQNLKTTKYNDGAPIPHISEETPWASLTTGGYCYFNNDILNKETYGALYNWYVVNTGKLAPAGWHVPADEEWDTLQNHLINKGYNWDGTGAGNKIAKALAARTDWAGNGTAGAPGNNASTNNASGFSALPGGYRYNVGYFFGQSSYCYWWSATECDASSAYSRYLYCGIERLNRHYFSKRYGFSVRLLRDN